MSKPKTVTVRLTAEEITLLENAIALFYVENYALWKRGDLDKDERDANDSLAATIENKLAGE